MNEEQARHYGRYVRHLLDLSRGGDDDAVALFLDSMDNTELKDLLTLMLKTV